MSQTIAYLRASTNEQDLKKNRADILHLVNEKNLGKVQRVSETLSGRISWKQRKMAFVKKYPLLQAWVREAGSVEIGYLYDVPDASFLRVIHYTELIWSSDKTFASLEEALAEIEDAIAKWCTEQGITLGQG